MAVQNVNITTVVGNLTDNPTLTHTQQGAAVVNFTIASTPRRFDRAADAFKDGDTVFYKSSVWRADAENFAKSLVKGNRVIAVGEIKPNNYEKDGVKVASFELDVHEIGASLAFATVVVTRTAGGANSAPAAAAPAAAPAAAVAAPAVAAVAAPVAVAVAASSDDDFS